jgi:hypothetical protein
MDLILPVLSTKKTVKLRINYPIEHLEAGNGTISTNHFYFCSTPYVTQ